jgi:actin-like ATPase involved in cell morphogenesis
MSMAGIVYSRAIRVAGDAMDDAIIEFVIATDCTAYKD